MLLTQSRGTEDAEFAVAARQARVDYDEGRTPSIEAVEFQSVHPPAARCVLVIASRFPPVASVGAIRIRKFVKYLPRNGWQPVVITGAKRRGAANVQDSRRATDVDSLRDLPDRLPLHRLPAVMDHWPPSLTRYLSVRLESLTGWMGVDSNRWASILGWRLQRVHDALSFPDRGIWRLPSATRLALALHRGYRFDAMITSGMPFSDHLIGALLHTVLRIPWIADFRDPWVEYAHWRQWKSSWGERLTRWAEAAVMKRAARIISVNELMTARFIQRYSTLVTRKFETIPNGFDPDDFPRQAAARPSGKFRLLYAGSLYKTRSPMMVLDAFRQFIEATPGSRQRVRFAFAGRAGPFTTELRRAGEQGNLEYLGMLPHAQALRHMADADVNVILLPDMPGAASDSTAKIYECLGSGRPILAVVPGHGAAAMELRGFDGVWFADPNDTASITAAICDLYRRWLANDLSPRRPDHAIRHMTRQRQAQRLAACLDEVVGCARPGMKRTS